MLFLDDFDQLWLLVNLGLTTGILVNLTWNGILSALMLNGLCHVNLDVSVALWRKDNIWNFRGTTHKTRANKIRCLQLPFFYLTSRVQWEVSNKERDFAFCCPKLAFRNCIVHGSRLVLPDKVELLQLIWKNFPDLVLGTRQETFFFWLKLNRSTLTRSMLTSRCIG